MPEKYAIAFFISPHGYGHAARAAGVMEALYQLNPAVRFEIFTLVPEWFFDVSLSAGFGYHAVLTDIGLVQKGPLKADLPETVRQLDHFLPWDPAMIRDLANLVKRLKCGLVISDIAPMGIAVARDAGIPSLLLENFTWDWIYQGYVEDDGKIGKHIDHLKQVFEAADYHIQTEPVCQRRSADLTTHPVSRKIKTPAHEIRGKLGIPEDSKAVLITMGGIQEPYPFIDRLTSKRDIHFVIPGASDQVQIHGNLALLPHHSHYFHPDLVNAADTVIGKVGYSTVAELYYAGVPFGYVARSRFLESHTLVSFIEKQMKGLPIAEDEFHDGSWLSHLPDLLALPRIERRSPLGAEQAARFIHQLMTPLRP
jgi:UDP:flavonoid glycosyltransferase YjiC (YdhE family)